jgi:hypothetical protein
LVSHLFGAQERLAVPEQMSFLELADCEIEIAAHLHFKYFLGHTGRDSPPGNIQTFPVDLAFRFAEVFLQTRSDRKDS